MQQTKKEKNTVSKLTIIKVGQYMGVDYLLQRVHPDFFQYVIFKGGKFFQTWLSMSPSKKSGTKHRSDLRQGEVVKTALLVENMAKATIDELLKMDDPNYKPENIELAEEVLNAIENPESALKLKELEPDETPKQ